MFDQVTLPNGLRIIGESIPYFRSVSVGLWMGVGSQYEVYEQGGISHFIEHMLFKGTEKRTAREIAEVMDAVGGQLNAFTAKECTCFYAKVVDDKLPLAVDVLSDLVRHSLFSPEDIIKEKGVVIEEINMAEDSPEDVVSELIMQARFGDQPLAWPILGTEESVSSLTRETILSYFNRMYRPDNCVLAIAGHYDWHQVIELAERYLGDWKKPDGQLPTYASRPFTPGKLVREKDVEQVHLCLGYPGVNTGNNDIYPLSVLNSVFGGASSSRLFQSIREDKGLVYSVYSYPSSYKDTGIVVVYAGTSPQYREQVLDLINREAAKLAEEGMTRKEYEEAKEQLKAGYILGLESTSSRMSAMGRRLLLLGETVDEEETLRRIDAITYEQVFEMSRSILTEQPALAMVGRGLAEGE